MQKINFEDTPSTDTPIDADNMNDLQDNVEEAIDEVQSNLDTANTYSTDEVVIGTLLGKPHYRKTILYENQTVLHQADTVIEVSLNSLPIDILTRFDCLTNGNNYQNSEINKLPDRYNKSSDKLTLDVSKNYTTNRIIIIIEYTKTTDTVGE